MTGSIPVSRSRVKMNKLTSSEINFYKPLIRDYLSRSSVDNVLSKYEYNPGVSVPHFHRILKKWGIVKTVGPNTRLSHALYFLCHMVKENVPLERAYYKSPSFIRRSVSVGTLHRIMQLAKSGLTRRTGTALLISPEGEYDKILIGKDISSSSYALGKPMGSLSLPMTYSKSGEDPKLSILRVVQREALSELAIERQIPKNLISQHPQEIFSIDIADVHVHVYRLILPKELISKIGSLKLTDLYFEDIHKVASEIKLDSFYRAGVSEIARTFLNLPSNLKNPPRVLSLLNHSLALLGIHA